MHNSTSEDLDEMIMTAYCSAKRKDGVKTFEKYEDAVYECTLTTALVTLPCDNEHQEFLVREVEDARDYCKEVAIARERAYEYGGSTE